MSPTWKSEDRLRNRRSFQFVSKRSEGTRHDMKSTWHQSSTEAVGLGYCWRRFVACTSVAPSAARACLNIFVRPSRRRDLLTLLARNFSLLNEYLPSFLPHLSPSDPSMYLQRHSVSVGRDCYDRHVVTIASQSPPSFAIGIKRELLRVLVRTWMIVKWQT